MKDLWKKFSEWVNTHSVQFIGIMFVFSIIMLVNNVMPETRPIQEMSYPEFIEAAEAGLVDTIYYNTQSEYMTITLYNQETVNMSREELKHYKYDTKDMRKVLYPAYDTFRMEALMSGINMKRVNDSSFVSILASGVTILFPLIMLSFLWSMMKSQMKGLSKKDLFHTSDVRFSDVIGQDEIIDDLKFVTELIRNPKSGDVLGAKPPKGILLQGPPGTGKTMIAKAIAGEAGVPFIQQSASAFIEMYVGLGAKRVRDIFRMAKKNAPCVVFIDEIDAIGMNRDSAKGTSENDQTINALLEEMDGFTGREGVFVIAATNRADKLDPALVRPGRFDRQVTINPPRDWKVRSDMFHHYLGKFKVADDVNIESLSRTVAGFTGADIAAVCNEASIIAMMKKKPAVDMECIEEAIDKKVFKGNRSKSKQNEDDRKIVAYHESGHAVMSYLLGEPITRVSILSTVSGVGGAVFNGDKDSVFMTQKDFLNRVKICYAGRASEEIKFLSPTTGASNDITQATNVLLQYVEHMGFDKEFGMLDMAVLGQEHLIDTGHTMDSVSTLAKELYQESKDLLEQNYDLVEALAKSILSKETMTGSEVMDLFHECRVTGDGLPPVKK